MKAVMGLALFYIRKSKWYNSRGRLILQPIAFLWTCWQRGDSVIVENEDTDTVEEVGGKSSLPRDWPFEDAPTIWAGDSVEGGDEFGGAWPEEV